jgi:signal transduction histidine kinase
MQQMEMTTGREVVERKRVESVVETLAHLQGEGESLAAVAHDARNMVTALGLYCDLLEEPGVLATKYAHYGSELRLVATASRRLVEKLLTLDKRQTAVTAANIVARTEAMGSPEMESQRATELMRPAVKSTGLESLLLRDSQHRELTGAGQIRNLASEMLACRNLLAALSGPAIALTLDAEGCSLPVRLMGEDLTRVLVNLVKNAAEAMPSGGRIQLGLHEKFTASGPAEWMSLTIEDNGPGISEAALGKIFQSGFTTKSGRQQEKGGWPVTHRGLGLAISRSIVEAAGGRMHASNRSQGGARFEIELPVSER